MGKAKYNINGIEFKSKKSVMDYVRENIYYVHPSHQFIPDEHFKFMMELLSHHDWSDQKIGVGVKGIFLKENEEYPGRTFWLERVDGTKTDFSFIQCLSPSTVLKDFKAACREAIAPFVVEFKRDFFKKESLLFCPVAKIYFDFSDSHVDHAPPNTFEKIVMGFIEDRGIDVVNAPLVEHNDGKIGNRFSDKNFKSGWLSYHNERVKYRVISAKGNLSIAHLSKK